MPSSEFVTETLDNGLTIVIEVMPDVDSAACGFLSRTGARDDPPEIAGVAHFLEHMMFKGTPKRTWLDINVAFDEMGAYYNAYTSKDRTFYYSWVQTADFERQLELLADMMRSTLPPEEFDTEKNVVLEEIAMSNDDLSSVTYDFLYEELCPGSSPSWPVLGYDRTIKAMTRDEMHAYFQRRYAPNNLILVVAGRVQPDKVMASVRRLCGDWQPAADIGPPRTPPKLRTGIATHQVERFHQQALALAFPAAPAAHELEESANAIGSILGGNNSRFFWNIMQKGISTRAGAFYEDYADFSLMILFGLCEPENSERLVEAMRNEACELTEKGPEEKELQRVKNLRRTSLAVESEAPFYRLNQLVDDIDYRGTPRPAELRLAAVDGVSVDSIADYCNRFPIDQDGMLISVGPRDWPGNA